MIEQLPEIVIEKENLVDAKTDNVEARADFNIVRENLHDTIKTIAQAIAEAAMLAEQSQNEKYYIALNGLLKTAVDANDKLLDQHLKIKELDGRSLEPPTTVNNVVVTTAAMLEMIEQAEKEKTKNGS